eukprot:TRINITY_DN29781_c0_g1_i1.p1 TRINITY_DN29781_c0_g1~~TRINITY_DN29781_c0_g1_i1.p1  ORF type:complete len:687 (+),score=253.44 TRINITY_DN29781_c0_g1_i1:90-2150(+)
MEQQQWWSRVIVAALFCMLWVMLLAPAPPRDDAAQAARPADDEAARPGGGVVDYPYAAAFFNTTGGRDYTPENEGVLGAVDAAASRDILGCWRAARGEGGGRYWLMFMGDSNMRNTFYTYVDALRGDPAVKGVHPSNASRWGAKTWRDQECVVEYHDGALLRVSMRFLWGAPYKLEVLLKDPTASLDWNAEKRNNDIQFQFREYAAVTHDGRNGPLSRAYRRHLTDEGNLDYYLGRANLDGAAPAWGDAARWAGRFRGAVPNGVVLTEGWGGYPYAHQLGVTLGRFAAQEAHVDYVYAPLHVTSNFRRRYAAFVSAVQGARAIMHGGAGADEEQTGVELRGPNYRIVDLWDVARQLPRRTPDNATQYHPRIGGPCLHHTLAKVARAMCGLAERRGKADAAWGRADSVYDAAAGTDTVVPTGLRRWARRGGAADRDMNDFYTRETVQYRVPAALRGQLQEWVRCMAPAGDAPLWVVLAGAEDMRAAFTALRWMLPWALRGERKAVAEHGEFGGPGARDDGDYLLTAGGRLVRLSLRYLPLDDPAAAVDAWAAAIASSMHSTGMRERLPSAANRTDRRVELDDVPADLKALVGAYASRRPDFVALAAPAPRDAELDAWGGTTFLRFKTAAQTAAAAPADCQGNAREAVLVDAAPEEGVPAPDSPRVLAALAALRNATCRLCGAEEAAG